MRPHGMTEAEWAEHLASRPPLEPLRDPRAFAPVVEKAGPNRKQRRKRRGDGERG